MGKYTHIRRTLLCLCVAWCCRNMQIDGSWLPPLPMQRVLGARGRPGTRSYRLAWTYIVPLAGIDWRGILIVNTTMLLWFVAKKEKEEEDQKSCALLWKFLRSCVSSLTGPWRRWDEHMFMFPSYFSEMVFTEVFIPASLVEFYFATQSVKTFSLHPLPVCWCFFLFSFVVWTQVIVIILWGQFKSFVSPLDFLGPCSTRLECGNPHFGRKQV